MASKGNTQKITRGRHFERVIKMKFFRSFCKKKGENKNKFCCAQQIYQP